MAEILARFKKEMPVMIANFSSIATKLTSISGAMVTFSARLLSISGQYTTLLANTSGLHSGAEAAP